MEKSQVPQRLYDLVVVGASAGGIEALSVLVATLPANLPVPLVIAQHLDPTVPSHLEQILARRSALPVQSVGDSRTERLEVGTIYVVPADRDVEITGGKVQLRTGMRQHRQHPMPSIDRLFTSAAKIYGERVIAVVLTGSGSDGTAGAREVKSAGGTVLIENPQTASYPAMPASLPPTIVDLVVDLERMGPLIADLISGAQKLDEPASTNTLSALLDQVRQQTGIDFSQYKSPTILRRLHRRMAASGAETLNGYLEVLHRHPEEYQHLVASFLINVTEFFRDPALFTYLQERIIPDIIERAGTREAPHEIRIWSAGCSTGEEPYSIAMLLADALGPDVLQFTVRIFATDIDADAVAFARRGRYPVGMLASVPEKLRTRYFTPVEGSYEIVKSIRTMLVFGEHDMGQRAPFPHIDLVFCRNVLIYFTPELQLHALQLFAFSLRDGGYLVLGNAESASALAVNFGQVHSHLRVYRRQGERLLVPPLPIGDRAVSQTEQVGGEQSEQVKLRVVPSEEVNTGILPSAPVENGHPALIHEFSQRVYTARERFADQILGLPVGVVVVERNYSVLTINSAAYALLDIHRPAIGKDFVHLADRVPPRRLRAAIDATFSAEGPGSALGSTTITVDLEQRTLSDLDEQPEFSELEDQEERRRLQIMCYPHLTTGYSLDGRESRRVEAVVLFIADLPPAGSPRSPLGMGPADVAGSLASSNAPAAIPPDVQARAFKQVSEQFDAERALTRELRQANEELRQDNDRLRQANEDLLVTQEEVQASSEETKTYNEEMQATNEELETLNEELEATVEELHTTNDDLVSRAREQQTLADEREAQRQSSERARAQLAAILSSLGEAVYAVDADGQPVLANETFEQLFGHADVTVLEDEFGQPLPPVAAPWRRLGENERFHLTFTLRAPDGIRRWFEASGQPIFSGERRLGGVVTIRDLSDRTMRSVYERFLAQVSHELATPIAVLLVRLQMLEKSLTATPAADAEAVTQLRAMVGDALRPARQMATLVGDLADLQRVQHDRLALTLEPIDLEALARRVADDLTHTDLPGQSNPPIVVQAELNGKGPILVLGDAGRLDQVISNLLTNALRYAPESERIDVRIRRVHERGVAEMAELEVRDYGPGILATDTPFVFMPFYQVPQSGVFHQGGLGLGLYIVQQLVQAHGGTIELHSPPGKGTVFTIQLPLAEDRTRRATSADATSLAAPSDDQDKQPPKGLRR